MAELCKELFAEGITDVYLYPLGGCKLPAPFSVAGLTKMSNCEFPNCALRFATAEYAETETAAVGCSSITAKSTSDVGGNGTVYALEVAAAVASDYDSAREALNAVAGQDCCIVLRTAGDTLMLGYTLPNTFMVKPASSITQSEQTPTITITAKAMSDFVPITTR